MKFGIIIILTINIDITAHSQAITIILAFDSPFVKLNIHMPNFIFRS